MGECKIGKIGHEISREINEIFFIKLCRDILRDIYPTVWRDWFIRNA